MAFSSLPTNRPHEPRI